MAEKILLTSLILLAIGLAVPPMMKMADIDPPVFVKGIILLPAILGFFAAIGSTFVIIWQ